MNDRGCVIINSESSAKLTYWGWLNIGIVQLITEIGLVGKSGVWLKYLRRLMVTLVSMVMMILKEFFCCVFSSDISVILVLVQEPHSLRRGLHDVHSSE